MNILLTRAKLAERFKRMKGYNLPHFLFTFHLANLLEAQECLTNKKPNTKQASSLISESIGRIRKYCSDKNVAGPSLRVLLKKSLQVLEESHDFFPKIKEAFSKHFDPAEVDKIYPSLVSKVKSSQAHRINNQKRKACQNNPCLFKLRDKLRSLDGEFKPSSSCGIKNVTESLFDFACQSSVNDLQKGNTPKALTWIETSLDLAKEYSKEKGEEFCHLSGYFESAVLTSQNHPTFLPKIVEIFSNKFSKPQDSIRKLMDMHIGSHGLPPEKQKELRQALKGFSPQESPYGSIVGNQTKTQTQV